jgi:rubrerythrin
MNIAERNRKQAEENVRRFGSDLDGLDTEDGYSFICRNCGHEFEPHERECDCPGDLV